MDRNYYIYAYIIHIDTMECVCVCLFIYWESAQDVITKEIRIYRLKNKRKKQRNLEPRFGGCQ